jgi:hypothetical protein
MITNAGLIAGSAAVLAAALAMSSPVYPKATNMGDCARVADGLADPCSGRGAPGLAGVRMIDVDVYTGRFPIRPSLEAVKSKSPQRRLSCVDLFGCRTLG